MYIERLINMSAVKALSTPLVLNTIARYTASKNMRRLATTSQPFARAAVRSLDNGMREIRALKARAEEVKLKEGSSAALILI
jgi:hypothetical protein